MSDVLMRGFKSTAPSILQDPVAAERIRAAKETAERVAAGIQAADDLRFWTRRIRRAFKRGKTRTTNQLSLRGSTHPYYMQALSQLLGKPFEVYAGYSDNPLPGGYATLHVTVAW